MRLARPSAIAVLPTPRVVLAPAHQGLADPLEFQRAAHQRIDVSLAGLGVEIRGELFQRTALAAGRTRRVPALTARHIAAGFRWIGDPGDTMGDEVDHVDTRDVAHAQHIDGLALLLAEDRHQHVFALHFVAAGGLHMEDRPLQHPLEGEGRLGVPAGRFGGNLGRRGVDEFVEFSAQPCHIHATGLQYPQGRLIVEQCQQQVFDCHELVPPCRGVLKRGVERRFQFSAEHGVQSSRLVSSAGSITHNSGCSCSRAA